MVCGGGKAPAARVSGELLSFEIHAMASAIAKTWCERIQISRYRQSTPTRLFPRAEWQGTRKTLSLLETERSLESRKVAYRVTHGVSVRGGGMQWPVYHHGVTAGI